VEFRTQPKLYIIWPMYFWSIMYSINRYFHELSFSVNFLSILWMMYVFPKFTEMFTLPYFTMESQYPITRVEFHHRDGQLLAGGLLNGQVALWDMRTGSTNIGISNIRNGHRNLILSLEWIQSKTNSEFLTGSSDGQVGPCYIIIRIHIY